MNAYGTYLESAPETLHGVVIELTPDEAKSLRHFVAHSQSITEGLRRQGLLFMAADFLELAGPLDRALREAMVR